MSLREENSNSMNQGQVESHCLFLPRTFPLCHLVGLQQIGRLCPCELVESLLAADTDCCCLVATHMGINL